MEVNGDLGKNDLSGDDEGINLFEKIELRPGRGMYRFEIRTFKSITINAHRRSSTLKIDVSMGFCLLNLYLPQVNNNKISTTTKYPYLLGGNLLLQKLPVLHLNGLKVKWKTRPS
jgi:hypothetical protein